MTTTRGREMQRATLEWLEKQGSTLKTGEVAEYLGITKSEVLDACRLTDGLRPTITRGGQRRFSPADVIRFGDLRAANRAATNG